MSSRLYVVPIGWALIISLAACTESARTPLSSAEEVVATTNTFPPPDLTYAKFSPNQPSTDNPYSVKYQNHLVGSTFVLRAAIQGHDPANYVWSMAGDGGTVADGSVVRERVEVCSATESCAIFRVTRLSRCAQRIIVQTADGSRFLDGYASGVTDFRTEGTGGVLRGSTILPSLSTWNGSCISPDGARWPFLRSNARWYSDDPSIAAVDDTGRVSGVNVGTTLVWAEIGGGRAAHRVSVLGSAAELSGVWTYINGPRSIEVEGEYAWYSQVTNQEAGENMNFVWATSPDGVVWNNVSTQPVFQKTFVAKSFSSNPPFYLRLTAHAGSSRTGSRVIYVNVASPLPGASTLQTAIYGNPALRPYQTCTYHVDVSGGNAPYSHQWYRNGVAVPGATSTNITAPGSGSFTLSVQTTDAFGLAVSAEQKISVSSAAPAECLQ